MLNRLIFNELLRWKQDKDRRVLLLRGARQIGKTFSVRHLARSFSSYIEVNFLEAPGLKQLFQGGLSPGPIVEKLEAFFGVSLKPGESLLFFDEIQACPEALSALRFFYEKLPELHVIATGSLLEFALAEIPSFGVGRVQSLFMYPLSFDEFVRAVDSSIFAEHISNASVQNPLDKVLHKKAVDLLRTYSMIGGLPAVVNSYLKEHDINHCLSLIEAHILGYEDDFTKYKTRISADKLRATFRATAQQVGKKFVYSHIAPEVSVSGFDQALELLCLAGLAYKIFRSTGEGVPLGAQINLKKFKVIPLDIGVYNRLLDMKLSNTIVLDDIAFVNSGSLAELICGLELIAHSNEATRPQLYYWDHEEPGANSKVDYLIQQGSEIVPIEVKAGTKGQMQSMYQFLKKKNRTRGIRASLESFGKFRSPDEQSQIEVVPLYAIGRYANTTHSYHEKGYGPVKE